MIIGLHGRAQSGKDTVCAMISELHDGVVIRKAFADPLKLSACRVFHPDATMEQALVWAEQMKKNGTVTLQEGGSRSSLSGRKLLQYYGTEAHRNVFGDNFWVDASLPPYVGDRWGAQLERFQIHPDKDFIIFTDVRFPNEAIRIKEWGGEIWEIKRDLAEAGDVHASEQRLPLELIDSTIMNNGSLEQLRTVVAHCIDRRLNDELSELRSSDRDARFREYLGQDD